MPQRLFVVLAALLLSACSTLPTVEIRQHSAQALAQAQGWQGLVLQTLDFRLQAFKPIEPAKSPELTIYLEGDGLAWISPRQPSDDPTPIDPVALRLALAHPNGQAVYLARPCQFLDAAKPACPQGLWTHARFASVVVDNLDEAITLLKTRHGAERLTLVGYSGGAALSLLLAARRDDVVRIVTVAGNLDHQQWTTHHRVSPLSGSLNPAELRAQLFQIDQIHLVGERDSIMPPALATTFVAGYPPSHKAKVVTLPGYDHHCCWAEHWADIWRQRVH